MKNQSKKAFIFSQRLAGYLMLHKFVLIDMIRDKSGSNRNIFIFNESDALCNAMKAYIDGR